MTHIDPAVGTTARSPLARALFAVAGCVSLLLGIVGIFVPGLPTTPFVLLAAACFAKVSPRLHRWLLNQRVLGPFVRDWEAHRNLTRRTKCIAIVSILIMLSLSAWSFAGRPWIQLSLLLLGGIGAWCVLRIPTRVREPGR